ncbi:LysE family translocator [bacterium]|nr:LysE family translocator [bacterium]MCB2179280.1 LysE family translocator [bacterium]
MELFLRSFLIGFTAAAAIGPIALLVIQRTLKHGWRVGATSGIGVALADAIYGLVGALGLTAITHLLLDNQMILRVVGGGVLVYLGIRAFLAQIEDATAEQTAQNPGGFFGTVSSIFLLTLSNPMTILFFSAVYAGLGSGEGGSLAGEIKESALFFPLGIFSGSFTWWMLLTVLVSALRSRFRPAQLVWLNRASGFVIAGFGVWIILHGMISGF